MKIIITENQHKMLLESVVSDTEFRDLIKGYESTVVNSKNQHYVFDDKDPKLPPNNKKTFIRKKSPYGGVLTIGWGHTGPSVKPGMIISNREAEQLLTDDIKKHEEIAKKVFPKFDTYPIYVQRALVNATYRGEVKSGYKWVKSLNANNWSLGAKQYLEGWNIDFSNVDDPRKKGTVAERMKNNQRAFLKYAEELSKPVEPKIKQEKTKTQIPKPQIGGGGLSPSVFKLYVVKPGETLSGIASKYDKTVTVDSIIKLNDLKSETLKPGQILKLK
jgi:GH24 family phage-related lysozyme (muramidase)/LysM repeat protein